MRDNLKVLAVMVGLVCLLQVSVARAETALVPFEAAWRVWDSDEAPPAGWEGWVLTIAPGRKPRRLWP